MSMTIAIGVVCVTVLTLVLVFKDRLLEIFFNVSPKEGSFGAGMKMKPKDQNLVDDIYSVDVSRAKFGGEGNKFSVKRGGFRGTELELDGKGNEIRFGEGRGDRPANPPDSLKPEPAREDDRPPSSPTA